MAPSSAFIRYYSVIAACLCAVLAPRPTENLRVTRALSSWPKENSEAPLGKITPDVDAKSTASSTNSELQKIKGQLYRRHNILALDRTDEHSPAVLATLLFLLDRSAPATARLTNLRYVYAYRGHDSHFNVAAYHWQEKAISIGGVTAYYGPLTDATRMKVLAAFAHELGHAFLLERLSPDDLTTAGKKFGNWPVTTASDFLHPSLLRPHPAKSAAKLGRREKNFASGYATRNMHEWFADAFAAFLLKELGTNNALGAEWQKKLRHTPERRGEYWADYNNISQEFATWIRERFI